MKKAELEKLVTHLQLENKALRAINEEIRFSAMKNNSILNEKIQSLRSIINRLKNKKNNRHKKS